MSNTSQAVDRLRGPLLAWAGAEQTRYGYDEDVGVGKANDSRMSRRSRHARLSCQKIPQCDPSLLEQRRYSNNLSRHRRGWPSLRSLSHRGRAAQTVGVLREERRLGDDVEPSKARQTAVEDQVHHVALALSGRQLQRQGREQRMGSRSRLGAGQVSASSASRPRPSLTSNGSNQKEASWTGSPRRPSLSAARTP
jgi:hypothetical protein